MEVQKELGQRIRSLRLERKLSLKDLSNITNLSIGFLSMVERGLTSVAIVSLKKIADALDQNISDLFQDPQQPKSLKKNQTHIINRSYEQRLNYHNGRYIYFTLSDNAPDHIIDPMTIVLLPGETREEVTQFSHTGEEFTYVLEGVLNFSLNGQEYALYPGDSFLGPCDTPHTFVNLSSNIVRVLYILTPPLTSKAQTLTDHHKAMAADAKAAGVEGKGRSGE